ncbi:MAG: chorismate synthase [Sphingobacteriales bacterium]|nr:chorismate synthase [Sphingobacteriales bacterium]
MSSNTFGQLFRITTFGESHGAAIGVVIDGCPSGIEIDLEQIQHELNRRKPGQSNITSARKESDEFEILSGIFEGKTLGTPIGILIRNEDQKSKDYNYLKDTYRPSHADYTYEQKYGIRDYRGGGRSSARETVARVAAGAIAKQILASKGIVINAFVNQVGNIKLEKHYSELNFQNIEKNIVRCPDETTAQQMIQAIEEVKKQGDTLGGTIQCVIQNTPVGLGEPVFDKLHAVLAHAMLSINAAHGFEYGSGFAGASKKGSENNDEWENVDGKIRTKTNHAGGILGGISTGEDIYFNVAFKPIATILKQQQSINSKGEEITLQNEGRHDPCVLPRAVPIVEAMAALVLVDFLLLSK